MFLEFNAINYIAEYKYLDQVNPQRPNGSLETDRMRVWFVDLVKMDVIQH